MASKKAEECFNRAIDAAEKSGARLQVGTACFNLGLLHKAKENFARAKKCFLEAIRVYEEIEAEVHLNRAKEALERLECAEKI